MRESVKIIRRENGGNLPWQSFDIEDPIGDELGENLRTLAQRIVSVELSEERIAELTEDLSTLASEFEASSAIRVREKIMGPEKTDEDVYLYIAFNPIRGSLNPLAAPLKVWEENGITVGEVCFGPAYEGPPGHVHGGYVAAIFDDLLACAQAFSGKRGFTGTLEIRFRAPTPLNTPLRLEGRFDKVRGRKIFAEGRMFAGDVLTAEATGTFIIPTKQNIEKLQKAMQGNQKT